MSAERIIGYAALTVAVLVIASTAVSWALGALWTRRRTDAALTPAEPVDAHAATAPTDWRAQEIADLEHLLTLTTEPEDHR